MMKTDLIEIFQTIRAQMQPYAVEGFKSKTNTDSEYHLCTEKNNNDIYFFGIEVKADYVGVYFKPIYSANEMDFLFGPDLVNKFKENDCFQITELDNILLEEISKALKLGFKFYKQKGWV